MKPLTGVRAGQKDATRTRIMHLLSASPRGGGGDPGLMWGNSGTLWGLCNNFLPFWQGKWGDFDFWMPYSGEECGDFPSVQLRGDKERSIVRSIDDKMVEEKKKVSFKIHCFLSIKQIIKKTVKNLYVFVGVSKLMKLLSLEKELNWKFAYLILSTVSMSSKTYWKKMFSRPWRCPKMSIILPTLLTITWFP